MLQFIDILITFQFIDILMDFPELFLYTVTKYLVKLTETVRLGTIIACQLAIAISIVLAAVAAKDYA